MQVEIKVPNGRKGMWAVESFKVSERDAALFNARQERGSKRFITPNKTYKRLLRYDYPNPKYAGTTVMSNTPAEIEDIEPFIEKVTGNVLVFGLGLGLVVQALINKEEVKNITVVEIDKDLIEFVGRYYKRSSKVKLIQGDAFVYNDESKYDAIWIDIWDDIDPENLKGMSVLKKRWKAKAPLIMCWCENRCRTLKRNEEKTRQLLMMGRS